MRVIRFIGWLLMLLLALVGVPVAFLTPGYEQLGYMAIIWMAVFLFVVLVLPRLPMGDLIRFQTQLVIWTGAAISLPFTFPIVSSWAGQPLSIGYAVIGIVARPLLKPLIENVLDWRMRTGRLRNLELATCKRISSAPELAQLAKSSALAEAVYSSVLLGTALTIVLAQAQTVLEPVEQRTAVSLVVVLVCPLLYHLHPHQRDLREYVANAKDERESAAAVIEDGCRTQPTVGDLRE